MYSRTISNMENYVLHTFWRHIYKCKIQNFSWTNKIEKHKCSCDNILMESFLTFNCTMNFIPLIMLKCCANMLFNNNSSTIGLRCNQATLKISILCNIIDEYVSLILMYFFLFYMCYLYKIAYNTHNRCSTCFLASIRIRCIP